MSDSGRLRANASVRIIERAVPAVGAMLLLLYAAVAVIAPLIFEASRVSLLYLTVLFQVL